jgi:hypothetical protein
MFVVIVNDVDIFGVNDVPHFVPAEQLLCHPFGRV